MGASELLRGKHYLCEGMILGSVETLDRSAHTKSAAMSDTTPAK